MKAKKTPYRYRSFLNYWLTYLLPLAIFVTCVVKLYYDGGFHIEPLKTIDFWVFLIALQVLSGFLFYIWDFVPSVKRYKNEANDSSTSGKLK